MSVSGRRWRLVADHHGEVVVAPFEFGSTSSASRVVVGDRGGGDATRRGGVPGGGGGRRALSPDLGVSSSCGGVEVVELNPAAVKEARSQQLLRRLKSDERDLGSDG